jgi:hypothetical protein
LIFNAKPLEPFRNVSFKAAASVTKTTTADADSAGIGANANDDYLGIRNDFVTRAMLASTAYFIYDLWAMFRVHSLKRRDLDSKSSMSAFKMLAPCRVTRLREISPFFG